MHAPSDDVGLGRMMPRHVCMYYRFPASGRWKAFMAHVTQFAAGDSLCQSGHGWDGREEPVRCEQRHSLSDSSLITFMQVIHMHLTYAGVMQLPLTELMRSNFNA